MTIPTSVSICGIPFSVSTDVRLVHQSYYGETDTTTYKIVLSPELNPEHAEATLLHEILHAIDAITGSPDVWLTEEQITRISPVLMDVIRQVFIPQTDDDLEN